MLAYNKMINQFVPIIDKILMPEKFISATRLAVNGGLPISNQKNKIFIKQFIAKLYLTET